MSVAFATAACEEARFTAMGCAVHVIVVDGRPGLAARAQRQVAHLESIWSRFRPKSDISRCNAAASRATPVSPLTVALVARAIEGWRHTGGLFDPTVLPALEAMGYDRSFELVGTSVHPPEAAPPTPGCGGIEVDSVRSTVTMPDGVRFDPGGIGKGFAADLIAMAMLQAGALGACINLGGDMRVAGQAPTSAGWSVALEDPYEMQRELARTTVADAGLATTSRTYRTWERAGRQVHHVIDPASGTSAWTGLTSVTVTAATAWWAEVVAKAAFVAGPVDGAALVARTGTSGLLVDDGGVAHPLPGCSWEVPEACLA